MKARVNLICIGVRDFKKSYDFYKNGLGFNTEATEDDSIAFFNLSGSKLAIYPIEKLAEEISPKLKVVEPGTYGGINLAYNAKSKQEVLDVIELARSCGAKIVKEPADVFWGGFSGYFEDPSGHYWEVAYGDMFEFDENDMLIL